MIENNNIIEDIELIDSDLPDEDEQTYEHFRFVVDKGQSQLRIDKFLDDRLQNSSRSKIQEAATAGNILVNDKPVKPNYKVKPDDIISIVMKYPPREIKIIPQDIPLNIVFEDEYLIIVNKPAGLVVHPSYGHYSGTLVNALAWHFKDLPLFNSEDPRPGLVHRIDKDTSGILVVAKTEEAKSNLALQFFNHTVKRRYNAIVWGNFDDNEGTIEGHVGRSLKDRKVMAVFPDGKFGKEAITHYKVLERFGYVTLIECILETGRTHQIRAHMKYLGHPLFNDVTYGGNEIIKGTTFTKYKQFIDNCFKIIPRQALHAKTLGIVHPFTGEEILFESPLPSDMGEVLTKWRNYAVHKQLDEE